MIEFASRVAGIPCRIRVTHWEPARPMRITGSGMGDADPPEAEEFEYQVLDRRGNRALWLERKVTDAADAQIYEDFQVMRAAEYYGQ